MDESPFELLNDGYHFHGILNHFKGFAVKKEAVLFPPWPERKLPSDFFSDPVTYWGHGSPPKVRLPGGWEARTAGVDYQAFHPPTVRN